MNQDKLKLFASTSFDLTGEQEQNMDLNLETAVLPTTGSVTGTIYDTTLLTGTVVPGATVKVFNSDGTPFMHTISQADGTYTISDLPLGTYTISAVKDGNYLSVDVPLIISSTTPVTINLAILPNTLTSNNIIYGKITNPETLLPVDGAQISLYKIVDNNPVLYSTTQSISDGEYVIDNIEDGTYQMTIQKSGYQTTDLNDIILADATKLTSNVSLTSTVGAINCTVSGIIKDDLGIVVPNAFVSLYKIENGIETLVATTYTNTLGKYMFGNVVAGNYMVKAKLTENV